MSGVFYDGNCGNGLEAEFGSRIWKPRFVSGRARVLSRVGLWGGEQSKTRV